MKLAIAAFHIESVSFLPEVATYDQFNAGALRGNDIVNLSRGTNSAIGGFVDFCEANDIDMEPIVVAFQGAVGPASDEAVARYTFEMIDALAQCRSEIDGVLLHLHGAAATPSMGDPDAFMIGAIRDV
ncbi:MAG: M81 family metallopeptidase, partial [Pseudomonadota bacterium]|nr:M81 family metallopeptidase [Pseudomonadota bacterium]